MGKATKARINDKPAKLLKNLSTAKSLKEAMLKAGYSESTANDHPGEAVNNAIKTIENRALEGNKRAQELLETIGMTREEVLNRLKYIALESNQHSVSLQALSPALRSLGYALDGNQPASSAQINIQVVENPSSKAVEYEVTEPDSLTANTSHNMHSATDTPGGSTKPSDSLEEKES